MRSLRAQLIGVIVLVLALGLGALLTLAGSQMATMTMTAFVREKQMAAVVAASNLSASFERPGDAQAQQPIQNILKASASETALDFTIIDLTGQIVVTTHDTTPTAGDYPEIEAALNGQVTSATRDGKVYIAVPLMHDRHLDGILWTDTSVAPVQAELQNRWLTLSGAALLALVLACAAGWWLSVRLVRPLTALQNVAARMAGGELGVRAKISQATREITTLEKTFNDMAEQIQGMMQRQREFVSNASHELRSPLATIKIRAEALASGALDNQHAHQYAADIDSEMTRLGRLVEDLLNLSRADDNAFTAPVEPINTVDELKACTGLIRPRAEAKHQRIALSVDPSIPDLFIYPNDLRVMVGNLLDNAVKYTPEAGCISLSAQWENKTLRVEVRDNGEGIPPQDLPRVTERFFRVDRAHTRTTPGTGLGLALVTAIAKHYRGSLALKSSGVPGEGTSATLTLYPAA